jgi:hypothetical protein
VLRPFLFFVRDEEGRERQVQAVAFAEGLLSDEVKSGGYPTFMLRRWCLP